MAATKTVFVEKDKSGKIRIAVEELEKWKAEGYKECKAPKSSDAPVDAEEVVINADMSKNEIAEELKSDKYANIVDQVDMSDTKANIVESIEKLMAPVDAE